MGKKAIGKTLYAGLNTITQVLPHPSALFNRVLVVLLKERAVGIITRAGQPRPVKQPVEQGKVLEETLTKDGPVSGKIIAATRVNHDPE